MWIYEIAELASFTRAREIAELNNFISSGTDYYRPSYGRSHVTFPRQCVFVGSTNSHTYLRDDTGGRRFLPVRVGQIDLAALRHDRDQLWAEATQLYFDGVPWHPGAEFVRQAEEQQEERHVLDPWEESIAGWLKTQEWARSRGVTTSDLLVQALGMPTERHSKAGAMRVAAVLRRLGYARHQVRSGAIREWRYFAPEEEAGQPDEGGVWSWNGSPALN